MSWKFFLYDWGGLNIALFQAINTGTPATLGQLAWFFSLVGSYWTAPLMMLGLWRWSKLAINPARGAVVLRRLIGKNTGFGKNRALRQRVLQCRTAFDPKRTIPRALKLTHALRPHRA